jgi:hypothetical protein
MQTGVYEYIKDVFAISIFTYFYAEIRKKWIVKILNSLILNSMATRSVI